MCLIIMIFAAKPVTIKLKPVYEVSLGPESLMWTVEWNSLGDCDMIIAGCQDGKYIFLSTTLFANNP